MSKYSIKAPTSSRKSEHLFTLEVQPLPYFESIPIRHTTDIWILIASVPTKNEREQKLHFQPNNQILPDSSAPLFTGFQRRLKHIQQSTFFRKQTHKINRSRTETWPQPQNPPNITLSIH